MLSCATAVFGGPTDPFLSRVGDIGNEDIWYQSNFIRKQKSFRTASQCDAMSRLGPAGVSIKLGPAPEESEKYFVGAEFQRAHRNHFGIYEVVMTAARGEGVISAFCTYTGSYYKVLHEEIDFEFLVRDTTMIWINRFHAGRNMPGKWIYLGFDAADAPMCSDEPLVGTNG